MELTGRNRWIALIVVCIGDLMIVLDATIVNVALPSIQDDLGFSAESLAWVANAYLLTFGGFMLLGGRLGDLFGGAARVPDRADAVHRRLARVRPRQLGGVARSSRARCRASAARSWPRSRSRC